MSTLHVISKMIIGYKSKENYKIVSEQNRTIKFKLFQKLILMK